MNVCNHQSRGQKTG